MKTLIAFSLAFCVGAIALAQDPSPSPSDEAFLVLPAFDIEIDTHESIKTGDTVKARIANPGAIKIESIKLPAEAVSDEDPGWDIDSNEKSKADGFSFSILALKPGHYTIPSLALQDSAGQSIARTNPLAVDIVSAIRPDDPKPKDPENPRPPVSLNYPFWLLALGCGLGLISVAALGYGIYRLIKRRNPKVKVLPEMPPKSEDEVALLELQELESAAHFRNGKFKIHYFGVSEILKTYLGARYRFDAEESTTEELMQTLERNRYLTGELTETLGILYGRLDLVKFTDHTPEIGEPLQVLNEAREFIFKTRRSLNAS